MSSQTRTKTHADPPQLMNEGREGYNMAQGFYQGQLRQPSVYQGERFAEPSQFQRGAVGQTYSDLGLGQEGGPAYRRQAGGEMDKTLSGEYLTGETAQKAVGSLAQPIFERFENQTMPGLRDQANFATRGGGGSRRTVAQHNATEDLGYNIGQGALAPIYEGERGRMTRQAIEGSQGLAQQDIARTSALQQAGEYERKLNELPIQAERDKFEEGLSRQAGGAESLASMATVGPGGSTSFYNPSTMRMILGSGKA